MAIPKDNPRSLAAPSKSPLKPTTYQAEENRLAKGLSALAASATAEKPPSRAPRPGTAATSAVQVSHQLSQSRPHTSISAAVPSGGSTWSFAARGAGPISADAAERRAQAEPETPKSTGPISADAAERRAQAEAETPKSTGPISADAAERRAQAEASTEPASFSAPEAAVDAVEQALEEGGPEAAAEELRLQATELPPEQAADLLEQSPEVVNAITQELGAQAEARDQNVTRPAGLEAQQAYDQMLADLAAATERAAQAESPQGEQALLAVTQSIVANIDPDEIGRFDEALGNAIASGSGASLSVAVVDSLARAGRTEQADDILQNIEAGTDKLRSNYDRVADKVDGYNAELGRLISDWQGLLTPEELESATQAFRDSHPEYAQLEGMGGTLVSTADQLTRLPSAVRALDHFDNVQGANDQLISEQVVRVGQTASGVSEMARIQAQHTSGQPDLLSGIESLAAAGELSDEQRDGLASLNLSAATQRAVLAESPEEAAAAWDAMEDMSATFGLTSSEMKDVVGGLRDVLKNRTAGAAAVQEAVGEFSQNLDDLGGLSPRVSHSLRGAGLLAGALATYGSVTAALEDPNFETVSQSLVSAADAGVEGVALLNSFRNVRLAQTAGFKGAGKAIGGLGAALDVYSAVRSLADGDLPSAGLHALSAAGGVAILAGGAWTGPGVVLAIGATAALYQLDRVRASNVQENQHTQAFLAGAGVTNPDVTYHLRNADDNGRSVGPVLTALAEHMDVPPTELFDWLSSLPPDEVIDFVETMHGVDPDGEGNFQATAVNDLLVDPANPGSKRWVDRTPHSLSGLETWLRVNGYQPPGG